MSSMHLGTAALGLAIVLVQWVMMRPRASSGQARS